jgi:AsmA protein
MPKRPPPSFESYRPRQEHGAGQPSLPMPGADSDIPRTLRRASQRVEPPRRGRRWLKTIVWTLLAAVLVSAGAIAFMVLAAPLGLVRDQLVATVKAKTGRDLTIAGPTSISVYPRLAIAMADVTLSQPPGMAGQPMVRMKRLEAVVQVWPLLRRQVAVERLVLQQPVIDLRVDRQGRRSWDFAATDAGTPRPIRLAQASGAGKFAPAELREFVRQSSPNSREARGSNRRPLDGLDDLALGDVRVVEGTLVYTDERAARTERLTALNVALALPAIASPLDARGDLVWKAERIAFEGKLTTLRSLLGEQPSQLDLKLSARPIEAAYAGSITLDGIANLDGALSARSPSLRALARWLGTVLPHTKGFGPLALSGRLKTTDTSLTLADASIGLDGAAAQGTVSVEPRGARPYVKANLQLSELDLNKYMAAGAPPAATAPAAGPAKVQPAAPGKPPQSIEDLLQRTDGAAGPKPTSQVRGFSQRAAWSEDPIDLAALGAIDLDAKLAVGRLLYEHIKIGQSQLTIALKDRVLRATFDDLRLYEGRGRGLVTVDGTGKAAGVSTNLTVEGVSAQPLLKDAGAMDWLAGRGKLFLALSGQGQSQRQIVETLDGKADFTFTDGAIVGFNIAQVLRGLQQGRFSGFDKVDTEKTDFSELAASFLVSKGVAQTKDLRLAGPLVRVTGTGTVGLPQRQLDLALRPKLVASLAGQGGVANLGGLEIPVKVVGPWDRPQLIPDVEGVLKNPDQAVQAVKELGRQLKSGKPAEALKGLLGGGQGTGEGGQPAKPKELLNQLLKR